MPFELTNLSMKIDKLHTVNIIVACMPSIPYWLPYCQYRHGFHIINTVVICMVSIASTSSYFDYKYVVKQLCLFFIPDASSL